MKGKFKKFTDKASRRLYELVMGENAYNEKGSIYNKVKKKINKQKKADAELEKRAKAKGVYYGS
jgi:hypothetical protein